jgi:hypothetical protein
MGDSVRVPAGPDRDDILEQPYFRSTMTLRRGWWTHFVPEVVALVLAPAGIVGAWAFWLQQGPSWQLVAVASVATAWSAYVTWAWGRRGLRRHRALSSDAPTLHLDGDGVWVRHPFGPSGGARLAWTDCVAAVVSPPPTRGRTAESYRAYVEFVALSPDRVEGTPHPRDQRTELLDRPAEQVLMVWMELASVGRTASDVAAWLRRWRPELRIVDSLDRASSGRG